MLRLERDEYLTLTVQLREIDPPIWRRLRVRDDLTLASLHLALQAAMGWENSHLYEFRIGDRAFGPPALLDPDFGGDDIRDSSSVRLRDFSLRPADEFLYIYDMGDDWEHRLRVEERVDAGPADPPAVCLSGARRCPPEDCGGVGGYADMLAALRDPADPEHAGWKEWVGPDYDPERFSVDTVNPTLAALFEPGGGAEIADLPPAVGERLDEVVAIMEDGAAREPRISEEVLAMAIEALRQHVAADPDALLRAQKLEGWAAGALHAVFLRERWGASDSMTQQELGELFGVSTATVSQRSSALRYGASGRSGEWGHDAAGFLSGLLRQAWEESYKALDEVERPAEAAPPWSAAQELVAAAETASPVVAEALYLRAADLLSTWAAALDGETLARLIRHGLRSESQEAFARFLALGIREFGAEAISWLEPGWER